MPKLIPAILEETKEGFLQKMSLVSKIGSSDRVQVDFGDGIFIPKKLVGPGDIDVLSPAVHWEAHLMIRDPKDFLDYQICGFKTLWIHYEAFESPEDCKKALGEIKELGLEAGLVLNPKTPIKIAEKFSGITNLFLVMGVTPGKQGQGFIEQTLHRVKELRKLLPNAIIEVDGGINLGNIKAVAEAGTDLIVAGSAIVGQGSPAENYEKLMSKITKA
jgi:ribulose-phosphate 3-epimerase